MRYIVLTAKLDGGARDPAFFHDAEVTLCKDAAAVQKVLRRKGQDWLLFEAVGGKAEPRSVCFEPDGKTIRSIQ